MNKIERVGRIAFGTHGLDVYGSLDDPIFLAVEVAELIDYSNGKTGQMLEMVENDEKIYVNTRYIVGGIQTRGNPYKWFVTELGLYNILSQSHKPIARGWRRVVHLELIRLRKSKGKNIEEQFREWDEELDNIYFDEETGMLMQSVTVPGGDVMQVPVDE